MAGLPGEASLHELGRVTVSLQEHFQELRGECRSAVQLAARRTQQLRAVADQHQNLARFVSELGALLQRFEVAADASALTNVTRPPADNAVEELGARMEAQLARCEADVEAVLSHVGKFVLVASFSSPRSTSSDLSDSATRASVEPFGFGSPSAKGTVTMETPPPAESAQSASSSSSVQRSQSPTSSLNRSFDGNCPNGLLFSWFLEYHP